MNEPQGDWQSLNIGRWRIIDGSDGPIGAQLQVPMNGTEPRRHYERAAADRSIVGPYVKLTGEGILIVTPLDDGTKVEHQITADRAREMARVLNYTADVLMPAASFSAPE